MRMYCIVCTNTASSYRSRSADGIDGERDTAVANRLAGSSLGGAKEI